MLSFHWVPWYPCARRPRICLDWTKRYPDGEQILASDWLQTFLPLDQVPVTDAQESCAQIDELGFSASKLQISIFQFLE